MPGSMAFDVFCLMRDTGMSKHEILEETPLEVFFQLQHCLYVSRDLRCERPGHSCKNKVAAAARALSAMTMTWRASAAAA